jgi:hypothetical protein
MAYSMFGTGKGAATAKPRPEKKPKPVSKVEPDDFYKGMFKQ